MDDSSPAYPVSLPPAEGPVFELTGDLLDRGCRAARESPRKRIIFPIHRRPEARVQRMLNFMQPGTYVVPHRHPLDHAIETVQVLRGALGFLVFDGEGGLLSTHRLSADSGLALLDIEPGIWHGMVVLEEDTVLLEIKRGPYDPATDKEFASWAPGEEGGQEAVVLMGEWRRRLGR